MLGAYNMQGVKRVKYTVSRRRTLLEKATPQFWIVVIFVGLLAFAGVFGIGKFLFRTNYAPLPVADIPTTIANMGSSGAASPTPTMTATLSGTQQVVAPWAAQMALID